MELFDFIPKNFFSLLSSKNHKLYVACLMEVFKTYEQGSILGMDRGIAVDVIQEYLDLYTDLAEDEEEFEQEASLREKANHIIRRMEECGWIDIDVTNDYEEILNFRDYAITIIEALKNIAQDDFYGYDDENHEFRGYIYTAYTLLTQDNGEYAMVVDQVYKNTIAFIREIRKIDSRMKSYIKSIVDKANIKDLIHLLISYKTELADKAYRRLKTSDNIAKYKAEIIKQLESFQQDPTIMEAVAKEFLPRCNHNVELARVKANKQIDDMIDIYHSLSDIIDEIDEKNNVYVNTTIAKIKFLLNDDKNVIGKLNRILYFYADQVKNGKTHKGNQAIEPMISLNTIGQIENRSLYTPRGSYRRVQDQYLKENVEIDDKSFQKAFYEEFETKYSEDVILHYLKEYFNREDAIRASQILRDDMSDEAVIRLLYILVYAGKENDYAVIPTEDIIEHPRFELEDFIVRKD